MLHVLIKCIKHLNTLLKRTSLAAPSVPAKNLRTHVNEVKIQLFNSNGETKITKRLSSKSVYLVGVVGLKTCVLIT